MEAQIFGTILTFHNKEHSRRSANATELNWSYRVCQLKGRGLLVYRFFFLFFYFTYKVGKDHVVC